jgi:Recombinase
MYRWFLHESVSMNEIAHRLNDAGGRPTGDEGRFYGSLVERTLRNPINKGVMGYGKHSTARYATLVNWLPKAISGDGSFRRKSRDQWVESPVLFEEPVSAEEWEAAIEKLEAARKGPRVGRNPELILSGLCICSHCGKLLSGWCAGGALPALASDNLPGPGPEVERGETGLSGGASRRGRHGTGAGPAPSSQCRHAADVRFRIRARLSLRS